MIKVKAGALYYAVFISFLSAATVVFLLLGNYLNSRLVTIELQKNKLVRDVNSAIKLVIANPDEFGFDSPQETDLFGDEGTLVTVNRKRFGVYHIVHAETSWKNLYYSKLALTGEHFFSGEKTALYMADKNKYLSVSGETVISGTCYLPKYGVRRAYIEGKGFRGDKLVYGQVKNSVSSLPEMNNSLFEYLSGYIEGRNYQNDSVIDFDNLNGNEEIIQSFNSKMLVCRSTENIIIKEGLFRGNIAIHSGKGILIGRGAVLEDVLLYAPNIYIEPGFSGTIQAFAADTLVVGNDCDLEFPSVLGIINKKLNNCIMKIESGSAVAGGIIISQKMPAMKEPELYIEESASVYGMVYCKGIVEHKGEIYGSLYCNGFALKTPSAFYENHLLNATVDVNRLSQYFVGFSLFQNNAERIIKWVE